MRKRKQKVFQPLFEWNPYGCDHQWNLFVISFSWIYFDQCFKTFLTRRTAFCFYMLKEKFLLRRKKILWRRRLKQGNFLAPFSKTYIILVENRTRPNGLAFQSLIGWFIPRRKGYPFSEKQFNLSTYRCTIKFIL